MTTEASSKLFEIWFGAYALLGAVVTGLLPLLLPLWVSRSGEATHVGLVMAALSLGQLSAPLWGQLADKRRWHRPLFVGGLLLTGSALVGTVLSSNPWALTALSAVTGVGVAATTNIANLFIVERKPRPSWGARLGLLQTFYGLGQVGGLVGAGLLSGSHLTLALTVTAVLPFVALAFTPALPRMPGTALKLRPVLNHSYLAVESLFGSLVHAYYLRNVGKALRRLKDAPPTLVRFQLIWFVINLGSGLIFSFYPLLMAKQYGLDASTAAWAYAAAAGLGLFLYAPAGQWAGRYSGKRILGAGILVRLGALAGLAALARLPLDARGSLALGLFVVMVLAWSLISVAGSTLAADASLPEGEAMGLFYANTALAGVVGALLGGVLASRFGYGALPLAATGALLLGAVLTRGLTTPPTSNPDPTPNAPHDNKA